LIYVLILFGAWFGLRMFRHKKWFFVFWFPLFAISAVGMLASFASILMAAYLSCVPGPGAPLEGIAVLLSLVLTLPFAILFWICLRLRPTKEAFETNIVLPTILGYVLLLLAVLLLTHCSKKPQLHSDAAVSYSQSQPAKNVAASGTTSNNSTTKQPASASSIPEAVLEYVRKSTEDPQYDWKQPINFYGRVVDENAKPVASANAHFKWTDLSANGTSEADVISDENGLFSLINRTGKRMSVTVGKDGYYSPRSEFMSFEYANPADGLFTPDRNTPVIFHLRKKGIGADLITSQYGLASDFQIHIPRDGTPIKVDLMQRKTGDSGQIQITESKPEYRAWKSATNWWFRLEIPDGGLIEQNDEFPFTAPMEGYQPAIEYDFQQGQNWALTLKTNFYIKFGNPPRYGRLQLETGIDYGGAILNYAINPDGSRNLEPK